VSKKSLSQRHEEHKVIFPTTGGGAVKGQLLAASNASGLT